MKSFKQLREDVDAKVKNPEATALKPTATGEQDFANLHKVKDTDYPVSGKGGTTTKATHQPDNGDRGAIQQGTSKLGDKSGFKGQQTPKRIADAARQGDLKPVQTSSSSLSGKWSGYATESVFKAITVSESDEDSIFIGFMNGDSATINEDTFQAIQDTFEQLNFENQKIFHTAVNESAESFERILDFVVATYEEE
jgi:hypothetical protein